MVGSQPMDDSLLTFLILLAIMYWVFKSIFGEDRD